LRAPRLIRLLAAVLLVLGGHAHAQEAQPTEELSFDRPESWGMKYFASVGLLTGLGVPERLGAGGVSLGFEGGLVPQLSDEQRRIGFNGSKLEDVNKTRFFGRLRGAIGISDDYSLDLAYTPPLEVGGARPHLIAVGIGRPFSLSARWRLGVRAYGQLGSIEGDVTCSAGEVQAGADPDLNPFLCEEPSADSMRQRLVGAEVSGGYRAGRWRPYVGLALTYMDLEFQVDARYAGIHDRTLQLTDGVTVSVTTGIGFAPSERWRLSAELFYSWLSVERPPARATQNDGLLNGRFFIAYQIH
jgi:hypothetical protein